MAGEETEPRKDKRRNYGGIFVPAGLFIGMGVGWAMGYMVQGMLIGLGAGFLLFGIIMVMVKD